MDDLDRYYEILELRCDATPEQVKQSYRDLVKVWHPDRFIDDARLQQLAQEKLKKINIAYEKLCPIRPDARTKASQSRDRWNKTNSDQKVASNRSSESQSPTEASPDNRKYRRTSSGYSTDRGMMPIRDAIESGAWFYCSYGDDNGFVEKEEFRLRLLSFEKVNTSELENPSDGVAYDGEYWILRMEIVSLTKKTINTGRVRGRLEVVDQDGFQFKCAERFLGDYNGYAARMGLQRFDYQDLLPKIKTIGGIVYLLPKDEENEYSLKVEDGIIRVD